MRPPTCEICDADLDPHDTGGGLVRFQPDDRSRDRGAARADDTRDRPGPWRRDPDAPRATPEERQARRDQRRAELLDTFDADQDGQLSDAERAAIHETRTVEAIARLDTNQDGALSADEFAELASRRSRIPDFATVDANHDGSISSDELMALPPPRRDRGNRGPDTDRTGNLPERAPNSPN